MVWSQILIRVCVSGRLVSQILMTQSEAQNWSWLNIDEFIVDCDLDSGVNISHHKHEAHAVSWHQPGHRLTSTSDVWLTFRLWLTYEDQSLYQTKNKVDVDINLTPGLHHWHKRVPSNDFVRICIWTWNFGCLFDMTIADYDSHVSIESLVSGTKTDDLESPCLSTCWSWLHVHQWLDFDWSTSDSDSTDTNLGLNVSDVCMNIYDLDSIKHIISITFDLPVFLNVIIEDLDCHSQSKTDELRPELTRRHRNGLQDFITMKHVIDIRLWRSIDDSVAWFHVLG